MVALKSALHDGTIVRYIDTHPNPKVMPATEYVLGQTYYLFRHLPEAATYYQRVNDQYPQSPYADDAYYNYLVALDDMNTPRPQMVELYLSYLEKFPQGKNVDIVQHRLENARNGR
jgi:outer membrane protein assembly factor BamD (BamD/ComL family)